MSRPQLLTGARGLLRINGGSPLGVVTDVNVNRATNVRAVHTCGSPNARSVEPLSNGVSVSIGRVFPMNDPTGKSVDSSDIALGIESIITQMLTAEDITVTLEDGPTGRLAADVRHCRFAGGSLGLSAQQLAQGRINLVGIFDAAGQNVANDIGL